MKLLIINGVTGALGNAILSHTAQHPEWIVYGLSRKARFVDSMRRNGYLPANHLVTSIGRSIADRTMCENFASAINTNAFEKIAYVHAVGNYPFEVDKSGNHEVMNDQNGDGIDDTVVELSYYAFRHMVEALLKIKPGLMSVIFGGIADKFKPIAHTSWWKTIQRTKEFMASKALDSEFAPLLLNISSVFCAHELLSRPFVFSDTDANPRAWLTPTEVASEVDRYICTKTSTPGKLLERDFFHPISPFNPQDYYGAPLFTQRKILELYGHG